jgi:hypothetical protein
MDQAVAGNLSGHRQVLGICWLLYGILRLIMGICLALFSGTSTVMFGALLTRVPNPFALMGDFHIVYAGLVVLSFLSAFSESLLVWHSWQINNQRACWRSLQPFCRSLKFRLEPLWEFIVLSFCSHYAAFLRQPGPKRALSECILSFETCSFAQY